MLIWEITPTSATDYDFTGWGIEENPVIIVGWTDFDAGGEFGYSPDGINFYPADAPEQVNAYRPKSDFVGILRIAPILDDIPIGMYSGMPTNDDDRVVGDPWVMTVWEFWITPCPKNWRPRLDDTLSFSAHIRPITDHKGKSMASIVKFFLTSSLEPGYCLNDSRETGAWNDTIGADLKFPDQDGFTIGGLDRNIATTLSPVTDTTVQVVCLDYGAYGGIEAMAYIAGKNETARLEGTLDVWMAKIPVDNDNNRIADSWAFNYLGSPTRDDDPEPPARIQGDGFSLYEEYRGFIVKGNWRELNPLLKDVFIVNLLDELYHPGLGLGLGYFPNLGITVHLISHTEHRGYVNFLHRTAHIQDQGCIVLTDGGLSPEDDWGATEYALPVPVTCIIYTQTIRRDGPPSHDPYTWDALDMEVTKYTIDHELGHAIHLQHHGTSTSTNCVMFVPQTIEEELAWWLQIPTDYCDNNPGCRFLWLLRPP